MRSRRAILASAIGSIALLPAPVSRGLDSGDFTYDAAVYSNGPAFTNQQRLILFPLGARNAKDIQLPFPLGHFAIVSGGAALYGEAGLETPGARPSPGLFKIEFNPTRVRPVPGSIGFRSSFGLAVSAHQDKLLISGSYSNGSSTTCGVFELAIGDGAIRQVLQSPDCRRASARTDLSLSPDGKQAVAIHNRSLELIDLVHRSVKPLGEGFYKAAWSPNGMWIAALEYSQQQRTILLDTSSFTQRRTLGTSELSWSPDSRYLLALKWQVLCGPEIYTLEAIDVETGKSSIVESSRCRLVGGVPVWVSSGIAAR
jgi:hypothetical protein